MRIATYEGVAGPTAAVVIDDKALLDVEHLIGDDTPVRDVSDLLQRDDVVLENLKDRASDLQTDDPRALGLESVRLLPPVLRPPTIRDHIAFEEHATRQFTRPVADVWRRRPIHYYTNPSRLLGSGREIFMPETERLDYELEIAAVIRRPVSDLDESEGLDSIFGFTIMNDWSARDLQADEMAYGLGPAKGKDFATSLGPWVVTRDELDQQLRHGALDAQCRVRVNGNDWGAGDAGRQAHSWGAMLAHASQDSLLLPGDVIASGTVGGCSIGEAIRKGYAARYLLPGDHVELEVDGIGVLTNTVAARPTGKGARFRYRAPTLPPMPVPLPEPSNNPN